MPELPEVETVVRGLQKTIPGKTIKKVIIREEKLLAFPEKKTFKREIKGRKIITVARKGKYIVIQLSGKKFLIVHLRMTGSLLVTTAAEPYDKYSYIIFKLSGKQDLRFNNKRKFGRVYLINNRQWEKAGSITCLGPEPLAAEFSLAKFKKLFKNRKGVIKSLLLKQDFIAGLGNIYTDESLFLAGIAPDRKADTLTEKELTALYRAIITVLEKAIKYCGTSIADYVGINGQTGAFQEQLNVYQQTGEKCPRCEEQINRIKISGRSSHFCPGCQK